MKIQIPTGIKILESLVGFFNFNEKSTTPKRFHVTNNNNQKSRMTEKVMDSMEYTEKPSISQGQQDIPNDSSGYYEDEPGISIEAAEVPIVEDLEKENHQHKKPTTSFKRIKLEDYKNLIFSLNPLRESRGIIKINSKHGEEIENVGKNLIKNAKRDIDSLESTTRKVTTHNKNMKLDSHKNVLFNVNPYRERNRGIIEHRNQEKYSESNIENIDTIAKTKSDKATRQNSERNQMKFKMDIVPIGVAMTISDEDFDYDEKGINKQNYHNNMRSRYEEKEPIRWRFRGRA